MDLDIRQIKELMAAMGRHGLKQVLLKGKNFELQLEKESAPEVRTIEVAPAPPVATVMRQEVETPVVPPRKVVKPAKSEPEPQPADEASAFVTSPMVGTFYRSSSPDSDFFVKEGDKVNENTVVCIIEAMKVMNEVKAEMSGTVVEVLVENNHPIEFGTKLFRIDPSA